MLAFHRGTLVLKPDARWLLIVYVKSVAKKNPLGICRGVAEVSLDGKSLSSNEIPLTSDEQVHKVNVVMGESVL